MRQAAIDFFTSNRLSLEGRLAIPEGVKGTPAGMVVCHPHPLLGGSMEHRLITAICRTAHDEKIASLRFNFRGVGGSEGTFSNGPEEQRDLRAAMDIITILPDIDRLRLAVVGYSFGASVILNGLKGCKAARSLVLIAPPLSSVRKSRIKKDKRPKLFMVGQRDRVVSSVDLQSALDEVRQPMQFVELPDAEHSLEEHEQEVADQVTAFLLRTLKDPSPGGGKRWSPW